MRINSTSSSGSIRQWFLSRVEKTDACWIWKGVEHSNGYGEVYFAPKRKICLAHRISWFIAHGSWPDKCVCHKCDNRKCVRPSHLFLGSIADNNRDMWKKGRGKVPAPMRLPGEQNPSAKYTEGQIIQIKRWFSENKTARWISGETGIHPGYLNLIKIGRRWSYIDIKREVAA